jgi:glycosyltransferase involved in cell wall biosynthesis
MRIFSITSGAGGMYCGSCIRDNALAAELRAQGHDVLLIPTYTPTLTDEPNVSDRHVYFGGVSVYLEQHVALFRHSPRLLDRVWDSPGLLKALSRVSISTSPEALGEVTVSMLRGEAGNQRKEFEKLVEGLAALPRPDGVLLPHSLLIAAAAPLRRALGVPVVCTLQGEDLFLNGLREPYRTESIELIRQSVATVDAFLAVSGYCAGFMGEWLNIPNDKMHVVPLGINLSGYDAAPRQPERPFTIGYFARVTPEKSLHLLAEAYRLLRRERGLPAARLEAAGYLGGEFKSYLREIENHLRAGELDGEFRYHGTLRREEKIRFLQRLDIISVPSAYAEPKGLYLLEAMACGVPFVEPRHGAFPEILEKTGGGVLFEPGNVESLADAIHGLWQDRRRREELGRNGYEGVRRHFSVARMAGDTAAVFQRLLDGRAALRATPAAERS